MKVQVLAILIISCAANFSGVSQDRSAYFSSFEIATFKKDFGEQTRDYFLAPDQEMDEHKMGLVDRKMNELLTHLEKRKAKSKDEKSFLKTLFYGVHRKVLKNYENHSLVTETLIDGNYDCVTGTAVYGLLLNELGYDFRVRELDFHIFLEIQTDKGTLTIESTDPLNGFDVAAADIDQMLEGNEMTDERAYQFSRTVNNTIGLEELAGLQYYNLAVEYYNDQEFSKAWSAISKALKLYNSPRIWEVHHLITMYASGTSVAMAQED